MKIVRVETWQENVPLSRPYAIASRGAAGTSAAELSFVRLITDGPAAVTGLGCAAPAEEVTGESPAACAAALAREAGRLLEGADLRGLGALIDASARALCATPAARAAVDMALWDAFARALGVPLVDLLGRCQEDLETSITIGIKDVDATLAEAREYRQRGFRCLKVKLGHSAAEDRERLRKLRERCGREVRIRVDANEGYTVGEMLALFELDERHRLELEFVEQPLPRAAVDELRALSAARRARLALDESLQTEANALELAREPSPARVWVVKLMKCGGPSAALAQASIARAAGRDLMWGSMDESAVSIAAALHLAYACAATRYLDLDGSLDLARDPAAGGFTVRDGRLALIPGPGLGVALADG